jgi:hypothetical protein
MAKVVVAEVVEEVVLVEEAVLVEGVEAMLLVEGGW